MHSIRSALLQAQAQLNSSPRLETVDARFESQLLLQHLLNAGRAWLIAHENDSLEDGMQARFEALVNRRVNGEPIAYILGSREFYGLNLTVTPATLIPRPDTEILVDTALAKILAGQHTQILDLGTGTGAIALAIAQQRPQAQVTGVDASRPALDVAISNSRQLHLANVHFTLSDWFNDLGNARFDVIVSNPPYIEETDAHLQQGDLRFEPLSALASGADGLDDIRRIIDGCLIHLKPQGWLMFEHGYNQAETVRELMAQTGLVNIETVRDFGGNDRVTIGKNPLIVSTHWD
ncbi:peptide chain release factor N(5)-glutamine methyltransferase [Methylotenera sp. G11]|uniref:peptide chain release factor N(5)-glutamine methyltransferase n=1 Tax=Methylotenera sp. G11 TaxID=1506585 RepID=UPI0006486820|nr:peptide chain release factor N(5)-glutamine methyltransferase [Methylotenera sp. G11]